MVQIWQILDQGYLFLQQSQRPPCITLRRVRAGQRDQPSLNLAVTIGATGGIWRGLRPIVASTSPPPDCHGPARCHIEITASGMERHRRAPVTGLLDLSRWPPGMRVIVRRERPHPGAQLRLTDRDGHRLTAFATNTTPGGPGRQLADLELRHRRRAPAEDRIQSRRTPGCATYPCTS